MKWILFALLPVLVASCSGSASGPLPLSSASAQISKDAILTPGNVTYFWSPSDIGGPGVEVNNQSCLNGVVAKGNCHLNRRFFKLNQLQAGVQYKNAGVKNNYFTTLVTYNHTYKPVIVTPIGGGFTSVCPPQSRCPATGQATLGTPVKGIQIVYN